MSGPMLRSHWRLLLFVLLVTRLHAADKGNQSVAPDSKADKHFAPDDSRPPVSHSVLINSNLPPYRMVLEPATQRDSARDEVLMGTIKVFGKESATPVQTIPVLGTDPSWFTPGFRMVDVNFDGYLDLVEFHSAGAKWRSDSYWLFDPPTGRFMTTRLTTQLGELMYQEIAVDAAKTEIRTSLWIGVCNKSFEVYRIERGKLVLIESEIHKPEDAHHCLVTRKKRSARKLKIFPAVRVTHPEGRE
jgi:hypothetical protein